VLDSRPLGQVIISTVLVIFSATSLWDGRSEQRSPLTGIPVEANRRG
jgi:hypothetical protein